MNTATSTVNTQLKLKFNCLVCPQCSNLLHDNLADYEKNKEVKSVACSNSTCDFLGFRKGFRLLNKSEVKEN